MLSAFISSPRLLRGCLSRAAVRSFSASKISLCRSEDGDQDLKEPEVVKESGRKDDEVIDKVDTKLGSLLNSMSKESTKSARRDSKVSQDFAKTKISIILDSVVKAPSQQPSRELAAAKINSILDSVAKEAVETSVQTKLSSHFLAAKDKQLRAKEAKTKIDASMMKAVDEVAKVLPSPSEQTKADLMKMLSSFSHEQENKKMLTSKPEQRVSSPQDLEHLTSILSSLKVERKQKTSAHRKQREELMAAESVFNGKPLGIWSRTFHEYESPPASSSTWTKLWQREMRLAVTHPATNGFQQMIKWTNEGKLWVFPIDNEQGLDEERGVGFHEHVFLERHLEPWCPKRGPIRHFMELVCVGLSKNAYLTVAEKKRHIAWFCDYFSNKRSILVESGAVEGRSNHLLSSAL